MPDKTETVEKIRVCKRCGPRLLPTKSAARRRGTMKIEGAEIPDDFGKGPQPDAEGMFAVIGLRKELSTLRASLAEREAALDLCKQLEKSQSPCGHLARYSYTEDGGKHIVCLLCDAAERDRQLVVLKEALLEINSLGSRLNQTDVARILEAALSSTSSAAERVERRIGAKYLREAVDICEHEGDFPTLAELHRYYKDYSLVAKRCAYRINERADALDRQDGRGEAK